MGALSGREIMRGVFGDMLNYIELLDFKMQILKEQIDTSISNLRK